MRPDNQQADGLGTGLLSANTAYSVIGNFSYGAARFFMFVVLAKYLTEDIVGQFSLAWAIVGPLAFLLHMELRLVQVTDTLDKIKPGSCLTTRYLSNILLLIALLGLSVVQSTRWGWEKNAILLLVGAVRIVESWSEIYLAILQKYEQMKYVAISQLLKITLILAWTILILHLFGNIFWVLIGWAGWILIVQLFYDRPQAKKRKNVQLIWNLAQTRKLVSWAFPLGIFITLCSFNEGVGRYFVAYYLGDSEVAYFTAVTLIVGGLGIVQNGVNQAVLPRLSRYFASDLSSFRRLLIKLIALCWLGMAAAIFLVGWQGPFLIQRMYQPDYAAYLYSPRFTGPSIFMLVMIGGFFFLTAMILNVSVIACQHFKSVLLAITLAVLVNIAACRFLIPRLGLPGAAWAGLLSAAVMALIIAAVQLNILRKARRHLRP